MINVNKGHSLPLMAGCEPLSEYAWVVDRIRAQEGELGLEGAIDRTIGALPEHFQIRVFLEAHRAEVKAMLLTEYNEEKTMNLFFKEGEESGVTKGENKITALLSKLLDLKRDEDMKRAINDPDYRNRLYAELNI